MNDRLRKIEERLTRIEENQRLIIELLKRSEDDAPRWMLVEEFAESVGLAEYTIRQACNTGRIPKPEFCDKGTDGRWRIYSTAAPYIRQLGLGGFSDLVEQSK